MLPLVAHLALVAGRYLETDGAMRGHIKGDLAVRYRLIGDDDRFVGGRVLGQLSAPAAEVGGNVSG